MIYLVKFRKAPRKPLIKPLKVAADDAAALGHAIRAHVRPHMRPHELEVMLDLDTGTGWVLYKAHAGGNTQKFSITEVP